MERAVCKVTVHSSGGADNIPYIGRLMEEHERDPDCGHREPLGGMPGQDDLAPGGPSDDDPVWTWNAPAYVTGDCYGAAQGDPLGAALGGQDAPALTPADLGMQPAAGGFDFSLAEKRERGIAYFSVLADLEELRGGPTHFRIVLTVGPEVTNRELKAKINAFLGENFPLNPALIAIHRNTNFAHAHLYVHIRQIDDARVRLGQKYFQLDESWMKICAERLRDADIYQKHIDLKAETLEWKGRAQQAREKGRAIPPKPDRWGDHHDTLLVFRPYDDRWCGRLQAQARVAETRVKWLEATKARPENLAVARGEARSLRERLDAAAAKRAKGRSEAKRGMPAEVITVEEARALLLYEHDIQRAEKGKGSRQKQSTPRLTAEQGALRFDELTEERAEQLGFDFNVVAQPPRDPGAAQPHDRAGRPDARERETVKAPPAIATAPTPADHAARSFGRELVAEVRLARTESSLSAERSLKERRRLKEQLIEDRREHARASVEAARHRSLLTARGADEPPYLLKDDERSYLSFMSAQVSERLRERIVVEVSRARIISDGEEEILTRREQEHEPPAVVSHKLPAKAEPSQPAVDDRKGDQTADTKGEAPPPVGHEPAQPLAPRPDDEVRRLTVQYELARAHAGARRVAEEDFNAAPHHWVSPKYKASLAGVEEERARAPEGEAYAGRLREKRERVHDELATEQVHLPMRRRKAEDEAHSLEARLHQEAKVRTKLGFEMPDAIPSAEELRELISCAEAARDARQLRRFFEAERERALIEAKKVDSGEPVRSLEERYAGVKLMAEVRADRSRVALAQASKEPDKTPLPVTDETGRDSVATLEQAGKRKGITAVLGRLVESGERRRLREQLLQTRDAYFDHLRADVEAREAFRDAAREIVRECRDLGRVLGCYTPAVPDLSAEQIQEARDHAVKRTGTEREGWLTACTQSQKLKDERELAAAEVRRAGMTVETFLPGAQTGGDRDELIRNELASGRERQSIESQQRTTQAIAGRAQPGGPDDPGQNRAERVGKSSDFGR